MVNLSTCYLQKGQSTAAMMNVEVPVYVSLHIYAVKSTFVQARVLEE